MKSIFKVATFSILLMISACVSKGPHENSVVIIGTARPDGRCKYLGELKGHQADGLSNKSVLTPAKQTEAMLETKSHASEMGGNYVVRGSVYQCPEPELREYQQKK